MSRHVDEELRTGTRPGIPLSSDVIARMRELRRAGVSVIGIARALNVTRRCVYNYGDNPQPKKRARLLSLRVRMVAMRRSGLSLREVACRLDVSASTVWGLTPAFRPRRR
jgi:orotate phosphoribosyltransferase-like protein